MPTITEINPQVGDVIKFHNDGFTATYVVDTKGLKGKYTYLDQSYFDGFNKDCDYFYVVNRANQTKGKQMKHTYKTGDWVEALESGLGYTKGSKYQITHIDESKAPLDFIDDAGDECCFLLSQVKPVMNPPKIIQVGKSYTTNNNQSVTILMKHEDFYVGLFSYGSLSKFSEDGSCIEIPQGDYDIDWGPVIEEGVHVMGPVYLEDKGHHIFNDTVTTIDGKPDWSTLKVEGVING